MLERERWQTLENSWKNTIFNEHPVDEQDKDTQYFTIMNMDQFLTTNCTILYQLYKVIHTHTLQSYLFTNMYVHNNGVL